jgi:hypothetical protein
MCGGTDQAKREQCVAVVERSSAIVIDGWGRVSLVGLDLMTIDGWVVVASIETYLHHADALGLSARPDTSWPTHFAAADG